MQRPFVIMLWFGIGVVCIAKQTSAADPDRVWHWLMSERQAAFSLELDQPLKIDFTIEYHQAFGGDKIASMRRSVQRNPQHPDQQRLASLDVYQRDGPRVQHNTLWVRSSSEYRHQWDYPDDPKLSYIDKGSLEGVSWTLNPLSLTVASRDKPAPPGRDPSVHAGTVIAELSDLVFGAIRAYPGAELARESLVITGDRWSVDLVGRSGTRVRIDGAWNEEEGRGFASGSSIVNLGNNDDRAAAMLIDSTGWKWFNDPGIWIATNLESRVHNVRRVYRVHDLVGIDEDALREVSRSPRKNRDVLRGELKPTEVNDYVGASSFIQSTTQHTDIPGLDRRAASGSASWARRLSVTAAVFFVATVVVVVIRRMNA